MITRLTTEEGPCAASPAMRRFKKILLRYISKDKQTRISILAEADKLCGRRGFQADTIDIPDFRKSNTLYAHLLIPMCQCPLLEEGHYLLVKILARI